MTHYDLISRLEKQCDRDDEMSMTTERLLQEAATALHDLRTENDNQHTTIVDLRTEANIAQACSAQLGEQLRECRINCGELARENDALHTRLADAEVRVKEACGETVRVQDELGAMLHHAEAQLDRARKV